VVHRAPPPDRNPVYRPLVVSRRLLSSPSWLPQSVQYVSTVACRASANSRTRSRTIRQLAASLLNPSCVAWVTCWRATSCARSPKRATSAKANLSVLWATSILWGMPNPCLQRGILKTLSCRRATVTCDNGVLISDHARAHHYGLRPCIAARSARLLRPMVVSDKGASRRINRNMADDRAFRLSSILADRLSVHF
jgi:hypothetical protein